MNKFKFLFYVTLFTLVLAISLFNGCSNDQASEPEKTIQLTQSLQMKPVYSSPDTSYIPIAWGSELKLFEPNIITKGYKPKYGNYWFTVVCGSNIVRPANYLQTCAYEQLAFADSVEVNSSSMYYICRRVIK